MPSSDQMRESGWLSTAAAERWWLPSLPPRLPSEIPADLPLHRRGVGSGPPAPNQHVRAGAAGLFKSVSDSLSATVLAWALIMPACCVIQDRLCMSREDTSSRLPTAPSGRIVAANAARRTPPRAQWCDRILNSAIGSPRGTDHGRRLSPASGAVPGHGRGHYASTGDDG